MLTEIPAVLWYIALAVVVFATAVYAAVRWAAYGRPCLDASPVPSRPVDLVG